MKGIPADDPLAKAAELAQIVANWETTVSVIEEIGADAFQYWKTREEKKRARRKYYKPNPAGRNRGYGKGDKGSKATSGDAIGND